MSKVDAQVNRQTTVQSVRVLVDACKRVCVLCLRVGGLARQLSIR